MGLFDRFSQLIKSNLNDLISRSEDPAKMLDQIILEMSTQLAQAKAQVAGVIADEKRLAKQFETERATAEEWERKAMMAVRAGDDELAKEALLRQKEHQALAAEFEKQWQKQRASADAIRRALTLLNNKIEEAKRKKVVLLAREKRARAQKQIHSVLGNLSDNSLFDAFARQEAKIDELEAQADATAQLSEEYSGDATAERFRALEMNRGADMALEDLKRKMGMAAPAEAPAARVAVRVETNEIRTGVAQEHDHDHAHEHEHDHQQVDEREADDLARVLAATEAEHQRMRGTGGEGR